MKKLRIVYFGTPDFAVASLQKLVENDENVVAVVTAPDKPKGGGKQMATSPVKDYALAKGLPCLQPSNLKSKTFIEKLASYKADLQIVVAFRMLPEVVWQMPSLGTFNLHASLLPNYRGAAPINWAIINGEKVTGVTTFLLKHKIDTGQIIFQEKEPITPTDTAATLYERLMHKGADLVLRTVQAITNGDYTQTDQPEIDTLKKAPKIFKADCQINWSQSAETIRNFIRGLSPYPAAWTKLKNKQLKVFEAEVISSSSNKEPGEFWSEGQQLLVQTGDYILSVKELQLEGKKRMNSDVFLRGYSL